MTKNIRVTFMTVSMTVILLFSSLLVIGRSTGDEDLFQALGNLAEVVHLIETEYVDELNDEALLLSLDAGIVESVDPWGAVLAPDQVDHYIQLVDEPPAYGLGLGSRLGSAAVRHVLSGSPAEVAGIEAWEVIESIEGVNTRGQPLWQILIKLADLQSKGKAVTLTMVDRRVDQRREVRLEPIPWSVVPFSIDIIDNVQVIKVESLPAGASERIHREIDMQRQTVLDLRNLVWGLEAETLRVADIFIDTGEIGRWKGQKAGEEIFQAAPGTESMPKPIVLVGHNTEGVGEILAAALKRSGATLLGTKTFGHAPHMHLVPAGDVFLWIPVGLWMLDDETAISVAGIKPDETIGGGEVNPGANIDDDASDDDDAPDGDDAGEPAQDEEDPVLKRALELLEPVIEHAA